MQEFYIEQIRNLLNVKRQKNRLYSMRALARDLDIPPSSLASILTGKRSVTPRTAYKLGVHLNLVGEQLLNLILPSLKESDRKVERPFID